jgi:hypothetical protein
MQMKNRTKIMFADGLEEMLDSIPLEKVRVAKLCELCEATTPTFYYYFHDKYELVAWMFLQDFSEEVGDKDPSYTVGGLNQVTTRMAKRRTFYQKALHDHSQNSIAAYLQTFNIQIARDAVMYHTGKALTTDQEFAVKYHVYGTMGMFREWLFGNDWTIEYLNEHLFDRTPDFLKEAFSVYPYVTGDILERVGKKTKSIKKQ